MTRTTPVLPQGRPPFLAGGLTRRTVLAAAGVAAAGMAIAPATQPVLWFFVSLALLFLSPGMLLARAAFGRRRLSGAGLVGWGFLFGVCAIGLALPWGSMFDLRLGSVVWWGVAFVAAGAWGVLGWRSRRALSRWLQAPWRPDGPEALIILAAGLGLVAKVGSVMGLAAPPLHDPASHALMARLIATDGQIPYFQLPFRADPFFYPPGFAALVAITHLFSGLAIPYLVLLWTNLSTWLAGFVAYALVKDASRSRGAGLLAFAFLAFLSQMPTNEFFMAGKNASVVSNFVFLGVLLAALRLLRRPERGYVIALGALLAELLILHYEKIYFLFPFLIAWLVVLPFGRGRATWMPLAKASLTAALLSVAFAFPWLLRLRWAVAYSRQRGTVLVPADPSPLLGTPPNWESLALAARSYWEAIQVYDGHVLAWLAVLAPVGLAWARTREASVLLIFAAAMAFLHPAVLEPLGISMATLSYDRISVHFAYLPTCLAAALGGWGLFRTLQAWTARPRGIRRAMIGLTALLLVWGGVSQYGLYRRVAATPVLDAADLTAIAWIREHLTDRRRFIVPVRDPDHRHRRYFVYGAGLYLPVMTGHDVLAHFLRIETAQIAAEYHLVQRILSRPPDAGLGNFWFYVRDDQEYYQPINRWLATLEPGWVHVRYDQGHVRILEVRPPGHPGQLGRLKGVLGDAEG